MSEQATTSKPCKCGKRHCIDTNHYDLVIVTGCTEKLWSLRPNRGGPLELRPWPGPNLTRFEMAEKEKGEAK